MAISEFELNEALNRAAALMSPEGQRQIEFAERQNNGSFDFDGNFNNATGSKYHGKKNIVPERTVNEGYNPKCGLPKAILESINKTPLNDVSNEFSVEGSILDSFDYKPRKQHEEPVRETYFKPIREEYTPQPQYIQQPQMMVDYNYIRAIVNECIQSNLQNIKNEIIKESTLKAIRVGGENKIQLIDSKNNLYESKLEFKKNISKK